MKAKLLALLLVVPLFGAGGPKPDAIEEELKKFEGKWKLASADLDGKEATPEQVKTTTLEVKGNEFTLKTGDETHKGKFTINLGKKPHTIDVQFTEGMLKDAKVLGIYEIEGDTRKSCFATPNADRPKDFTSGKDKYVWTWKRDKP
jgi:uncharacterized protein (TIGR03067 family)